MQYKQSRYFLILRKVRTPKRIKCWVTPREYIQDNSEYIYGKKWHRKEIPPFRI